MAFTRNQLQEILANRQVNRANITDTSGRAANLRSEVLRAKKLGGLQRLIAGLSAFETGNALYRASDRPDNTPGLDGEDIKRFLSQYGQDIKSGLTAAVTGKNEGLADKKTYKDVLKRAGMKDKTGGKWYQNIDATDVLGFAGDVLLDPSTYVTAGTAKGAQIATKEGSKTLTKEGSKALLKLSAKVGDDVAQKTFTELLEKSPKLAAKYLDQGGIKFAGKKIVGKEALSKVGLSGVGERGFIMGGKDDLLDLAEKAPVVGEKVAGARQVVREAFDKGAALKGTPYEGLTDKLTEFTKGTTREIEDTITGFLDSAHAVVKKHQKEYGGVEGLGKAITQYVEDGKEINPEVAQWVDESLRPALKRIGIEEQDRGALKNWIEEYLPRYDSKEWAAQKANQAFGARAAANIKPTIGADNMRTVGRKFVAEDGTEVIGELPGQALVNTDLAKPLKKEVGELTKQMRSLRKAGDKEGAESIKQQILSIKDRLNNEILGEDGKIYRQQGTGTQSQIDEWLQGKGQLAEGETRFNPNVFETVPKRMAESIRQERSQDFLKWMSDEYGENLGKPRKVVRKNKSGKLVEEYAPTNVPDGYETLNIPGLEGKAFPKEVTKHLKETHAALTQPDATAKILKHFDNIQSLWKLSVTTVWPAFHARNLTGGMFNNWLAGIKNPKRYGQASLVMKYMADSKLAQRGSKEAVEDIVIDLGGKKFKASEILEMYRSQGVGGTTGMMDIMKQAGSRAAGTKADKAKRALMLPTTFTAEQVENFLRLPLFMDGLAKGETAQQAAKRVFKYHFDYDAATLTKLEQGIKRVIPFYTWARRNIPLQFEELGKQPGKYATVGKLMQSSDRESYWNEQATNPEYLSKETAFRLPDGKYLTVGLPMADLAVDPKSLVDRLSPFIKTPIEAATNYNLFYGKPIVDELDTKEEATEKKWEWFTRSVAGRGISTFKDAKEIYSNESGARWDKISKVFLGANPVDVKKQAPYVFRDMLLENLPKDVKMAYQAAHIPYEDQYPLLASTRKASAYLDFPELFMVDQALKQFNKEKKGYDYDPIYNLPWEKAKLLYAQTAKGDKWNADELEKLPWFTKFSKVRSAYFKGANKKDSDYKIESASYSKPPSAYVAAKLYAKDYDDPVVSNWLEKNKALENEKRAEMGLLAPNMYNKIKDDIYKGGLSAKSTKDKLKYMQAIRLAGLPTYDKFFTENPHLDPKNGGGIK